MKLNIFIIFFTLSSVGFSMTVSKEKNNVLQKVRAFIKNKNCLVVNDHDDLPIIKENMLINDHSNRLFNEIDRQLDKQNTRLNQSISSPCETEYVNGKYYNISISKMNSRAKNRAEGFIKNFKLWKIKINSITINAEQYTLLYIEKINDFVLEIPEPRSVHTEPDTLNVSSSEPNSCPENLQLPSLPNCELSFPFELSEIPQPIDWIEQDLNLPPLQTPESMSGENTSPIQSVLDKIAYLRSWRIYQGAVPYIYEGLLIQGINYEWGNHLYSTLRQYNIEAGEQTKTFINFPDFRGDLRPALLTEYESSSGTGLKLKFWMLKLDPVEVYYYVEQFSQNGSPARLDFTPLYS